MMSSPVLRFGARLISSAFVPLLLVLGLMMAPVSCTCGASVPHGHSLFQLPSHHHGANVDQNHHDEHQPNGSDEGQFAHQSLPLVATENDCDKLEHGKMFSENFALANALEQQDGAVLKAPPSSSFGQPMVMAQPSSTISPVGEVCEPLTLPATRILEGTESSPETPPPRA